MIVAVWTWLRMRDGYAIKCRDCSLLSTKENTTECHLCREKVCSTCNEGHYAGACKKLASKPGTESHLVMVGKQEAKPLPHREKKPRHLPPRRLN